MCVMKCRSDVTSNLGNGTSIAMEGKLTSTQTGMKSVVTTDSLKFKKYIATNLKPATHFLSFTKAAATG